MLTAQTLSTQIELCGFTVDHNSSSLNIRQPATSGMLFRMAYPMAEVHRFATDIAFCRQMNYSLYLNRS